MTVTVCLPASGGIGCVCSRVKGSDWSDRFPRISEAVAALETLDMPKRPAALVCDGTQTGLLEATSRPPDGISMANKIFPWRRPRRHDALAHATEETIDREVTMAYERARAAGEKPPNLNEIVAPVRASLAVRGYFASARQIRAVARREKHARHRLPVGNPIQIAAAARRRGGGD